jgi:hypothetical protein
MSSFKKIQYIQHHINPWGEDFGARLSSISYTDRLHFEIGKIYEIDVNKNAIYMTTDIHVNDILIDKSQYRYVLEYNPINEILYPEFEKVKIRGEYWLADKLPELYYMKDVDYTASIQIWSRRKYPPKKNL